MNIKISNTSIMLKKLLFLLSLFLSANLISLNAQTKNQGYVNYINKYAPTAQQQQKKYGIPASIKLAQGLLESQAGNGRLAKEANNHFGIKCGDWTGRKIYHDDDKRNECFRRYSDVMDSYTDHSLFLAKRDRYSSLFDLKTTDYKGWAKGLKKCGYATDPKYPEKLIKLIEDYDLHKYDKATVTFIREEPKSEGYPSWYAKHQVYKNDGLYYVVAKQNDTYALISKEIGISQRKLRRYNEVPKNMALDKGDIIYLQSKNKKVSRKYPVKAHIVGPNDTMHDISQKYGIRLKYLYKINNKGYDYYPKSGDVLRLR